MNRSNIWVHIVIAIVLIGMAAVAGQIGNWVSQKSHNDFSRATNNKGQTKPLTIQRSSNDREAEVLVRFKPNVSLSEINRIAGSNNDRIEDEIETVRGLVAIDDLDNASPEAIAKQYEAMSNIVEYAEPNFEIKLDPATGNSYREISEREADPGSVPNDPMFADQWALNNVGQNGGKQQADIGALPAWAKSKGSKKVVIAVLDTGVDYTHRDLVGNMWIRPDSIPAYEDNELGVINDLNGYNSDTNQGNPMDENGHGTHCAGVIGAEGDNNEGIAGINWKVEIMALKFLGRSGFGSTKNAIEAINYAVDRKRKGVNIRVISASWGSTAKSKALEDAIRAAGEEGILFVAAAGNDGTDNDKRPHYPSNYKLPNVISVAALDRNDALAGFSNFGAKTVHIAAPGKDIVSTWLNDGFREASGTSMATPQVSGVAALILATDPRMPLDKLRERLLKSVDQLDSLNGKVETGGRINAAKALGN